MTGDTASSVGANTYLRLYANNPSLYDGQQVTASIYMALPTGSASRTVTFQISDSAASGGGVAATQNFTVTQYWQRFDLQALLDMG